jgi:hypothetical protein
MGLTRFPHGIMATPNIGGAGRLIDLFNSDNIFFVDNDSGNDGNTGKSPTAAKKLISAAVTAASAYASIYVKPRVSASSAQLYIQDNIEIPQSKPGLSIFGAGNTGSGSGVQLKPLTVTTHLIDVKGSGLTLENMRLTLNGGTADLKMSIVHAVNSTSATPSGLQIRNCRFEGDKSVPSISSDTDICSSIALGSANYSIIEDNIFYACHGSIVGNFAGAAYHNVTIRRNIISGNPSARAVDFWFSHAGWGLTIENNIFADGLPTHAPGTSGNYFLLITDAGTGILAGNYFASSTSSFKADGSEVRVPDTFFMAGNTYDAASAGTTTAGMFGTSA